MQQPNSPIIISQIDLNGDDENNTIDTRLVNPTKKRMRLTSGQRCSNVTFQQHKVSREQRGNILGRYGGFRGCSVWFTGLSGAGKTTISFAIERILCDLGLPAYGIDGDNMRQGVCANLGFTTTEREENIRRVAEVSKLFADMGVICLASFISPFEKDRANARTIHDTAGLKFIEVYVNAPLEVCEQRDTKGIRFTGIDSVYEPPTNPELIVDTATESVEQCVHHVLEYLYDQKIIPERAMQQLRYPSVRELFALKSTTTTANEVSVSVESLLPKVNITDIDLQWLQVLAEGWATPLYGFMRERQYLQCLHYGQLLDLIPKCTIPGEPVINADAIAASNQLLHEPINQSIPIVLAIDDAQRRALINDSGIVAQHILLVHNGKTVATLKNGEIFAHRKEERVARQFGFCDIRHPTIKLIMDSGDWLLGGDIEVFDRIRYDDGLDEYRLTPVELRSRFADMDCDAVFVFQLRNPIHNGHALLMRDTREQLLKKYRNPMLLLHPLGGWTKDDDVPLAVRIAQHRAVLDEGVLDPQWTVLAIFPSPMLYAGPTEVQWHARARMSAGVHTYIVGRDPAGIQRPGTNGDYLYDPTHGAKVLSMAPGLTNLEIIPFRDASYDKVNKRMDFCDPTRKDDFESISGTKMREFARNGQTPPDGFMAPKAWQVLASYYAGLNPDAK